MRGLNPLVLMVMRNSVQQKFTAPTFVSDIDSNIITSQIKFRFDLKGSKVKREVFPADIQTKSKEEFLELSESTLKDLDLVWIKQNYKYDLINVSEEDKRWIVEAIERDTQVLMIQGIMDYSLLLAVERVSDPEHKSLISFVSQQRPQDNENRISAIFNTFISKKYKENGDMSEVSES